MASVEVSALSKAQHDELACTYAALLLHDGELEITVSHHQLSYQYVGGQNCKGLEIKQQLSRSLLARTFRQGS